MVHKSSSFRLKTDPGKTADPYVLKLHEYFLPKFWRSSKSDSEKAWEWTTYNRPVTLTQNMFHAFEITRSQDLPLKYLYKSRVHVLGNAKWKQWESCVSGKSAIWPYILSNISHKWPEYFHDRGQITIWTYYRDFLEITSLLHINIYYL